MASPFQKRTLWKNRCWAPQETKSGFPGRTQSKMHAEKKRKKDKDGNARCGKGEQPVRHSPTPQNLTPVQELKWHPKSRNAGLERKKWAGFSRVFKGGHGDSGPHRSRGGQGASHKKKTHLNGGEGTKHLHGWRQSVTSYPRPPLTGQVQQPAGKRHCRLNLEEVLQRRERPACSSHKKKLLTVQASE